MYPKEMANVQVVVEVGYMHIMQDFRMFLISIIIAMKCLQRSGKAVYVFRNHDGTALSSVDGIWRCVIPDSNGREQTK